MLAMPGQELFKGDTQDATLTEILGPLTLATEEQRVFYLRPPLLFRWPHFCRSADP